MCGGSHCKCSAQKQFQLFWHSKFQPHADVYRLWHLPVRKCFCQCVLKTTSLTALEKTCKLLWLDHSKCGFCLFFNPTFFLLASLPHFLSFAVPNFLICSVVGPICIKARWHLTVIVWWQCCGTSHHVSLTWRGLVSFFPYVPSLSSRSFLHPSLLSWIKATERIAHDDTVQKDSVTDWCSYVLTEIREAGKSS